MSIKTEVLLATSSDDRFPGSNAVDGSNKTFWHSTGLFPQEILVAFKGNAVNINKIRLTSTAIKKLRVERTTETVAAKFDTIVECELTQNKETTFQVEQFQVNSGTLGKGVRFLKLVVESGYEPFVSVTEIAVEGQEAS